MGIPSVVLTDYEYAQVSPLTRPDREIVPMVITMSKATDRRVLKYTGFKEDIYVPSFVPDPAILEELALSDDELVVTVRPPAVEAHYHIPESEEIFHELIKWLLLESDAKVITLPRNAKQEAAIRTENDSWFDTNRTIISNKTRGGLSLLFISDVVISGEGTMNREAAALGIPVYNYVRGPIGSMDRKLEAEGRLKMIASATEIPQKIILKRCAKTIPCESGDRPALGQVLSHIIAILRSANAGSGRYGPMT